LRWAGWNVTYVRNWTDVDDKIIRRAAERGEDPRTLADRFIAECREDFQALSVIAADIEPRATDHIPEMQKPAADAGIWRHNPQSAPAHSAVPAPSVFYRPCRSPPARRPPRAKAHRGAAGRAPPKYAAPNRTTAPSRLHRAPRSRDRGFRRHAR